MQPWVILLALSWTCVIGLAAWAFRRLLLDEGTKHFDPDGVGPATPPVPGHAEAKKKSK